MSIKVDLELKRAFAELQSKMLETSQKLKLADVQIETLKRSINHAQLTDKELNVLDVNTRTYQSVGRMFLLTEIPEIRTNLKTKVSMCTDKIKTLENNKSYLERNLKESENNIREMVQQRKETVSN